MKIVQAPDPTLSQAAQKVGKIDRSVHELIAGMKDALLTASDPEGVGIAAPQVGKSLRLFLIKPEKDSPIHVFINPEVTLLGPLINPKSKKGNSMLEGCLSLKDIWGTVQRHRKIQITYLDEKGKENNRTFSGWVARIIQHEHDHLEGILFPKRVLEQQGRLYKSHKDEQGQDEFEPLHI